MASNESPWDSRIISKSERMWTLENASSDLLMAGYEWQNGTLFTYKKVYDFSWRGICHFAQALIKELLHCHFILVSLFKSYLN